MQVISPSELQGLLSTSSDVDIVDVREADEWKGGHVPGARLVPLSLLQADPWGALPREPIVFVCAKGGRSAKAAALAEEIGRGVVYSLNGGTDAWRAAGLPIVMPGAGKAATAEVPREPEPGLDVTVGKNLQRERQSRGWSLDELAREAGVSRTVLGQIEIGRTTPSIGVLWKIAQALGVHFSTLLATSSRLGTTTSSRASATLLTSADGRFSSRALHPLSDPQAAEFYELWLAPHSREDADAHRPGTRENLIVASGTLELKVGAEVHTLKAGDVIAFSADQPHSYRNTGADECRMYLVMNYAAALR